MSNGSGRKQYHKRKKELFALYKAILSLIYNYEKLFEENKKEIVTKHSKDKSKRSMNINFIRDEFPKLYSKNDRTGFLNPTNVQDTIQTLEELGIISVKKRGKQEQIIHLTQVGIDLQEFIDIINKYTESYFTLFNTLSEKLLFIPSKYLSLMDIPKEKLYSYSLGEIREEIEKYRLRLLDNGWKGTEIILYNDIRTNLIDLKTVCDKNFFNMVLLRYAKIRKKHEFKQSLLLEFFNYLIKKPNEKKIDFILRNYEMEVDGYPTIRHESPINLGLARDFSIMQAGMGNHERIFPKLNESVSSWGATAGEHQYFKDIYNIFYSQVISFSFENEIKDMVTSYIELLGVHLGEYDQHVDGLKDLIERLEEKKDSETQLNSDQKNKIILSIKTTELFLNILQDYARRKNMHMTSFFNSS
ncbi:MAG: hypothetical protein R2685_16315 [Candidatus Nitrosocosmicus sp.]|nr:hypothetical protein [Candidatus Nitrosocosmicus sp.]